MKELKNTDPASLSCESDIGEIIALSKKLLKVIEQENKLLQENQMSHYQEVVDNKLNLIANIEELGQQFNDQPDLLLLVSMNKKLELKGLQEKLEELRAVNSMHLKAAIFSNKKISQIIKEILINRVKMKSGYCSKGLYNSEKKCGNKVPAMSYNTAT
jgi:hypothetical protein